MLTQFNELVIDEIESVPSGFYSSEYLMYITCRSLFSGAFIRMCISFQSVIFFQTQLIFRWKTMGYLSMYRPYKHIWFGHERESDVLNTK